MLTEEVLERNGWSEFRGTWFNNLQFGLQFFSDDLGSCWNVVGDENPDVVVGSIRTVSDLRRLLDVFGIEETVVVTTGGER